VLPEAGVTITYSSVSGTFADGTPYTLQVPSYSFYSEYMTLSKKMLFSPRVAPFNFGLGLLEAIPEATILSREDPNDANDDGISGVANRVWDAAARRPPLAASGGRPARPVWFNRPPARTTATWASRHRCSRPNRAKATDLNARRTQPR
jgi:CxxC motif-containing protein (DUF1111 family)